MEDNINVVENTEVSAEEITAETAEENELLTTLRQLQEDINSLRSENDELRREVTRAWNREQTAPEVDEVEEFVNREGGYVDRIMKRFMEVK